MSSHGGRWADVGVLGVLPLQHFDPDWPLEDRIVLYAGRPKQPQDSLEWGVDKDKATGEDTYGDVLGSFFWPREERKRPCSAWWLGPVPAVVVDGPAKKANGKGTTKSKKEADAEKAVALGTLRPLANEEDPDGRFAKKGIKLPEWASRFPGGWPGLEASTTNPGKQAEVFIPGFFGLVASNSGDPEVGTRVFDTNGQKVDPKRWAWLQDGVDVVDFGEAGAVDLKGRALAWQLGRGGKSDEGPGYALFSNHDFQEVAVGHRGWGGCFDSGEGACQHALGTTADGRAIHPLHAPSTLLFIDRPTGGDAPLAFTSDPWITPTDVPSPLWAEVKLKLDKESGHVAGRASGIGLWRWQVPTPVFIPPPLDDIWDPPPEPPPGGDPPPIPGDGFPDPIPGDGFPGPVTGSGGTGGGRGGRTPTGEGIGVDTGGPLTGHGPIGTIPGPGKPRGNGGSGGTVTGTDSQGGTGIIGGFKDYPGDDEGADGIEVDDAPDEPEKDYPGDDEGADGIEEEDYPPDPDEAADSDSPEADEEDEPDEAQEDDELDIDEILDQFRKHNEWPKGMPGSSGDPRLPLIFMGDDDRQVEMMGPQMGTVDGKTPLVGQSGAYYPANPHTLGVLTTPGLEIKATSTLATDFDPKYSLGTLTAQQFRQYQLAPTVGRMFGFAKNPGGGGWNTFEKINKSGGTGTPKAQGVIGFGPPDVTDEQIKNGTAKNLTECSLSLLMQKDLAAISFGLFHEGLGTSRNGVKMKGTPTGLMLWNEGSDGEVLAGPSILFGEGGTVVTGKLTVTGRLDPTTVEFIDTTTDNIPNGKAGFRFDSATSHRPLWKRADDNSTNPIAYLSDVASTGLPKRYIEGLLVRYASSSTFTVSAGKARNKADTGDMTLGADVTVNLAGTANTALSYERKALTGTISTTSSSTSVTGASSAFLTEFAPANTPRQITGTISNSGTAVTGTGTKFLSEVTQGDLIGTSGKGYYRVQSINSDTSITFDSGFLPAAAFAGEQPNVIERVRLETAGGRNYWVAQITSDTALKILANAAATESTVAGYVSARGNTPDFKADWRAVWLLKGGSGTTVAVSTQRTTPLLSISGYDQEYRRIGWVLTDGSGNLIPSYGHDGGCQRRVEYEDPTTTSDNRVGSNLSSSTTWASVSCAGIAPPTARLVWLMIQASNQNTTSALYVRGRGLGSSTAGRWRYAVEPASSSAQTANNVCCPCDGAQYIDHSSDRAGGTGDGTFLDVQGYEDTLE